MPRHALENLAIEGYRARVLTFMKRAGVPLDYTVEDFQSDASTGQYLREARNKELQGR